MNDIQTLRYVLTINAIERGKCSLGARYSIGSTRTTWFIYKGHREIHFANAIDMGTYGDETVDSITKPFATFAEALGYALSLAEIQEYLAGEMGKI